LWLVLGGRDSVAQNSLWFLRKRFVESRCGPLPEGVVGVIMPGRRDSTGGIDPKGVAVALYGTRVILQALAVSLYGSSPKSVIGDKRCSINELRALRGVTDLP